MSNPLKLDEDAFRLEVASGSALDKIAAAFGLTRKNSGALILGGETDTDFRERINQALKREVSRGYDPRVTVGGRTLDFEGLNFKEVESLPNRKDETEW